MSRAVLTAILAEIGVMLNETEKELLYHELLAYFGLVGALNKCQALENAWQDPYNKREIEEFIRAWLRRKQKRGEEIITWVI
ncbi:MAG: hypothetical protein QXR89_01030 [Candidatus Bathyarchaeia archaeon]